MAIIDSKYYPDGNCAETIAALRAENETLRQELSASRDKALEDAARVAENCTGALFTARSIRALRNMIDMNIAQAKGGG